MTAANLRSDLYRSSENCHAGHVTTTASFATAQYQDVSTTMLQRYRLDVIATDVADAIESAGGWLFDRALAGWDVNLLTDELAYGRSLQILGVKTQSLKSTLEASTEWRPVHALAVAADVFNTEACVRDHVLNVLDRGLAEVTLWGDTWPPEFHQRAEHVQHRLSAAARAFKAQALSAAELPQKRIIETETFRGGTRWSPPYEPDLVPVR
jgi:hypothetical protein